MLQQDGHVINPVPKRRQVDADDVDAIVEVGAELPLLNVGFEISCGGREDTDVELPRLRLPDPPDLSLLQRPEEFYLKSLRQLADLVQEQRPALCLLKQSRPVARSARERTLHMTEELGLQQILGNGATVDRDERTIGTSRRLVYEPRHEFFPRSTLTRDQDGGRMLCDPLRQFHGSLHSRARHDDVASPFLDPDFLPQPPDLRVLRAVLLGDPDSQQKRLR